MEEMTFGSLAIAVLSDMNISAYALDGCIMHPIIELTDFWDYVVLVLCSPVNKFSR